MSPVFEQLLIKNLLSDDGFLGGSSKYIQQKNRGYLLGLKEGFVFYNLEKVVFTYTKVLGLVKKFKKHNLKILFIGCPFGMEKRVEQILHSSQHFFITSTDWIPGHLSNNQSSFKDFSMIVTFNQNLVFSNKEFFKKETILVSFLDESKETSFIDFPLLINIRSKSVVNMYHYLLKQSI